MSNTVLCPRFQAAFSFLGKRWVGIIIKVLFDKPSRFKDINEKIPGISQKVLTERLKELEEEGIIKRVVFNEKPVRIEYCLTEMGKELKPVLEEVQIWAAKWMKQC
ncbi:winged helix-turn-helix transcriptional regulator [Bacillus sp. AK031]